jgi:hypothetical protein
MMRNPFCCAEVFEFFIDEFPPSVGDEESNRLVGFFLCGHFEFHESIEGFMFVSKEFDRLEATILVDESEKVKGSSY